MSSSSGNMNASVTSISDQRQTPLPSCLPDTPLSRCPGQTRFPFLPLCSFSYFRALHGITPAPRPDRVFLVSPLPSPFTPFSGNHLVLRAASAAPHCKWASLASSPHSCLIVSSVAWCLPSNHTEICSALFLSTLRIIFPTHTSSQ